MSRIESDPCLSSDCHRITDIRDLRCHFIGCVPIADRLRFLNDAKVWTEAVDIAYKSEIEENPASAGKKQEFVKDSIHLWYTTALALDGNIKRIDLLRSSLKELTSHVDASRERWRESDIYEKNVPRVEEWRKAQPEAWHFSDVTMDGIFSPQQQLQEKTSDPGRSTQPGTGDQQTSDETSIAAATRAAETQAVPSRSDARNTGTVTIAPAASFPSEDKRAGTRTATQQPASRANPAAPSGSEMKPGKKQAKLAGDSASAIRERIREIIEKYRTQQKVERTDEQVEGDNNDLLYRLERDVKAQFIQLRREPHAKVHPGEDIGVMKPISKSVHDQIYKGQFPDQQLSVEKLTTSQFLQSPVHQMKDEEIVDSSKEKGKEVDTGPPSGGIKAQDRGYMVRYFHIPCNNMMWVKNAMGCYFKEEKLGLVLRPDLWKGQQHGSISDGIVHSRHLRSLCKTFSTDASAAHENNNQENMVLFMPFLHWESDRMRSIITETIEGRVDKEVRTRRDQRLKERNMRKLVRDMLPKSTLQTVIHSDPSYYKAHDDSAEAVPRTIEDILWDRRRHKKRIEVKEQADQYETVQMEPSKIFLGVTMDKCGRLRPINPLAQYLIDAARLYEAMATYQESQVIEHYLFRDPPVHPRRSLDRAYFWKLRTTHRRDRDQVVYRSTHSEFAHRLLPYTPAKRDLKRCIHEDTAPGSGTAQGKTPAVIEGWKWTGHGKYEDEYGCKQCKDDICKLSRAVMVDQLWMWILDNDTILTCFPQRYGLSQKDPSGVHQSIRTRLKDQTKPRNHVRSVFDLGLIILDEAFNVFFDRTKTADKRPQVLDIFAESIGKVTNKQTIGFRHLWELAEDLADIYQSPVDEGIPDRLVLPLLNITHEGRLQREIRDIIDELDIMIHIVRQQEEVIRQYISKVQDMPQVKETEINSSVQPPAVEEIKFNSNGTWTRVINKPSRQATGDQVREWEETIRRQQHKSFEKNANMLVAKVADTIRELEDLRESADMAAQNVNDLIGLKQEQASVVQAYQAMKQGEETVRQGRAIMLFTVMTIVFLPLSFMTSLFGMNAVELTGSGGGGNNDNSTSSTPPIPDQIVDFWAVTFKRQIAIMFSISFFIIILALILAFSPPIRSVIASFVEWLLVGIKIRSGLYKFWLSKDIDIEYKIKMRKKKDHQKEDKALKERQREKERESWENDGVIAKRSLKRAQDTQRDLANRIRTTLNEAIGKVSSHSRQNLLRRRKARTSENLEPANGDV